YSAATGRPARRRACRCPPPDSRSRSRCLPGRPVDRRHGGLPGLGRDRPQVTWVDSVSVSFLEGAMPDGRIRQRMVVSGAGALLLLLLPTGVRAGPPAPTVRGPITSPGSAFVTPPSSLDLSPSGYVEEEFFLSGTASAYTSAVALGSDGRWAATPG